MILYKSYLHPNFMDYGILIPIADDRASMCFNYLTDHFGISSISFDNNVIIKKDDLLRVHSPLYVDLIYENPEKAVLDAYELINVDGTYNRYDPSIARKTMPDFVREKLLQTAGTYQAMSYALNNGFCYYLGGGMHHAMSFGGRGFCLINDIVIGLRRLQFENKINTAWVIDVDAHKGDGTAETTKDDDSIKTFSIHMESGWPLDGDEFDSDGKQNPSFIPSDIDIPISLANNSTYILKLEEGLKRINKFNRPDLAVIVNGADPFEHDELAGTASLRLSEDELLQRDQMIYNFLKNEKIPQIYTIAGGYGKNSWKIYANFLASILREEGFVFRE